ncbi:MAG: hypothetical protein KDD62_07245, partial [Bdellovibrionales bacterium]|nr:hypothetical protein [Bdellovibrionales bacterium]
MKNSSSSTRQVAIGSWRLLDRVGIEKDLFPVLEQALDFAQNSRPGALALFSHYQVGSAAFLSNGEIARGRNIEYGAGFGQADARALHSEEAVIANAVEYHALGQFLPDGSKIQLEFVALVHECQQDSASCGNCLDIQATYAHADTLLINAHPNGSGTIIRLADAFPTNFQQSGCLTAGQAELLVAARVGMQRSFDFITAPVLGKRGASVRVQSGNIYSGVHIDGADYKPISSVTSAISAAIAAGEPL